ncbi:sensor domain-containing diguanylate cyclase [Deinococcus aquaedulcis]|uniref:sensor domain-containing diguanylate cyclase n=1 Tax=Deinococcus aquaedulcis TaxID=2840455 RepID=UPI001C83F13F|nr:sensor domain-containing diguanylate cyclase [Deinococcus aquaedulcis]
MSAPPSSLPQWRPRTPTQALRAFAASRAWLLSALLLTQALTLLAALWTERQWQERALRAQAQTNLTQMAQLTSVSVQTYLQAAEQIVQLEQRNVRAGLLRPSDEAQTLQAFDALLDTLPQLSGVMAAQADGRFVFARRDGPQDQGRFTRVIRVQPSRRVISRTVDAAGRVQSVSPRDEGYDPRQRPWYQLAQARPGQVVWTDPYVFATSQEPGITAALGDRSGLVVGVDVQLQQLADLLRRLPLGPQGRAFLADAQGRAIATSRAWPGGQRGPDGQANVPLLSAVADAPLHALLGPQGRPQLFPQAHWVTLEGELYAAVVQPVQVQPGVQWVVGVYGPAAELMGAPGRRGAWPFVLLTSLLSGLLAWPLVRRATRPLAELQRQATTDPLTGLPNRASFLAELDEVLRQPPEGALGVAIFDLDGFKAVNDTYGHPAGDEVLHAVGARMLAAAHIGDTLGRLGGDEFALIVQADSAEEVRLRVEGVLHALGHRPVTAAGVPHALTSTAGLAFVPAGSAPTPSLMLARADTALIRGKRREKGRLWVDGEVTMPTLFR